MKTKENASINGDLLKYLLWAQCSRPARFRVFSQFIAWAEPLGFDADQCRETWTMLKTFYRPLYGNPVFETIERKENVL